MDLRIQCAFFIVGFYLFIILVQQYLMYWPSPHIIEPNWKYGYYLPPTSTRSYSKTKDAIIIFKGYFKSADKYLSNRIQFDKDTYLVEYPGNGFMYGETTWLFLTKSRVMEWVREAVAELASHYENLHLICYSFGCCIGAEIASLFPDKVAKIVLIAPMVDMPHLVSDNVPGLGKLSYEADYKVLEPLQKWLAMGGKKENVLIFASEADNVTPIRFTHEIIEKTGCQLEMLPPLGHELLNVYVWEHYTTWIIEFFN